MINKNKYKYRYKNLCPKLSSQGRLVFTVYNWGSLFTTHFQHQLTLVNTFTAQNIRWKVVVVVVIMLVAEEMSGGSVGGGGGTLASAEATCNISHLHSFTFFVSLP